MTVMPGEVIRAAAAMKVSIGQIGRAMFHVKQAALSIQGAEPTSPPLMGSQGRQVFHVKHQRWLPLGLILAVAILASGCVAIQEAEGWAAPVEVNDHLLVQSERGQLSLIDRDTGAVAWRYPDEFEQDSPFYATPVVDGSRVYLASFRGRVVRLQAGAAAPSEDWSLALDTRVVATPILRGSRLYVPTEAGQIVVVDSESGRITDTIETSERRIWGSPAATTSTIFIGDLDNRATAALDLSSGEMLWEQSISGATAADLALDGDLLLVGSFDQHLHAIDITNNGEERWAFQGSGWFMGRPLVAGDVVYVASMSGGIYAVDRSSGTAVWSRVIEGAEFRSSPVIVGGSLVAVARDGHVHSLALSNGELQWSQQVVDDGRVNADVFVDGTELYLITSKQRLIRVDLARGGAFQSVPLTASR